MGLPAHPHRSQRFVGAIVVAGILVAILGFVLIGNLVGALSQETDGLDLVLVLIVGQVAVLAFYLRRASRAMPGGAPFNSTVSIFAAGYVVFFLAMPITWLLTGTETAFSSDVMITTMSICFVGLIAWGIGYFSNAGSRIGKSIPKMAEAWNERRLFQVTGMLTVLLILVEIAPFSLGFIGAVEDPITLTVLLIIVAMILTAKGRRVPWVTLAVLAITLARPDSILSGRRDVVRFIMGLAILWHNLKSPIRVFWVPLLAVLLLASVILVGFWRSSINWDQFTDTITHVPTWSSETQLRAFLTVAEFPTAFENLEYVVVSVPENAPYLWGVTYLKPLFWWIPRSIWPEKPESVMMRIVHEPKPYSFAGGTSQGVTILGEMYWNLGIPGVIVGMFVFGVSCRVVTSYGRVHSGSLAALLFYATAAPVLFEQFRGGFGTVLVMYLITQLAPLIAINKFVGVRRRPPHSEPGEVLATGSAMHQQRPQ